MRQRHKKKTVMVTLCSYLLYGFSRYPLNQDVKRSALPCEIPEADLTQAPHKRKQRLPERCFIKVLFFPFWGVNISEYTPNISHYLYIEQMCYLEKIKREEIFLIQPTTKPNAHTQSVTYMGKKHLVGLIGLILSD